ncbi:uncharacterized protein LOC141591261 [Silene latifolia]|uniref:uncharacterized protein LOC141591261 n=1 Tax=Silene latifolia TaxID=37657 RepID=UPI003D77B4AA
MASGAREFLVDLECGGGTITSEDEGSGESGDTVPSCRIGRKTLVSRATCCNGAMSSESDTDSSDDLLNKSNAGCRQIELVVDKCSGCEETEDLVAVLEKRNPGEPRKKQKMKKPSKPPRPPKGPLLNASDLKLVKELSEIAARKRARIERMKALRKMKQTKRPNYTSSITALIITLLFFIIIIFQGAFSGSKVRKEIDESPAPANTNEGLISIQLFNNAPTNQQSSVSFDSMEQPSSSNPQEEGKDA